MKSSKRVSKVLDSSSSVEKDAKEYIKMKAEIADMEKKMKEKGERLLKYVQDNGGAKSSAIIELSIAGHNFQVVNSTSEEYDANAIHEVITKIDPNLADQCVQKVLKVNSDVLAANITAGRISRDLIVPHVTSKPRKPYLKVT